MNMPGSGSKPSAIAAAGGVVEHGAEAVGEPLPDRFLVGRVADHRPTRARRTRRRGPRRGRPPARENRSAARGRSRSAETSVGSCLRSGSSRCRAPVSITQAMPAAARACRQRAIVAGRSAAKRIEQVVVERDRERLVAEVAEDRQRVERGDVADAVGAEAEQHGGRLGTDQVGGTSRRPKRNGSEQEEHDDRPGARRRRRARARRRA